MARTLGSKSNISIPVKTVVQIFGKYPELDLPISISFLREAKKFFKLEIPGLDESTNHENKKPIRRHRSRP